MHDVLQVGEVIAKPGEKQFGRMPVFRRAISTIDLPVIVINGRATGVRALITAGIHGSEYAGIEAAARISQMLDPEAVRGSVVVLPTVNVPGFEAREANLNPVDNLNINRIFPGDARGSASLVMADRLVAEAVRLADFVIDLHGGDAHEWLRPAFTIYVNSGDVDVDRRSARLAHLFDTRNIWATTEKTGTPGTFGSALASRGIPYVTSEAGFLGTYQEQEIRHHIHGVVNCLRDFGILEGSPELSRTEEPTVFEESFAVSASSSGIMHPEVLPGEWVEHEQLLATVRAIDGSILEELRSPANGFVRTLFPRRVIDAGSVVYRGWLKVDRFSVGNG